MIALHPRITFISLFNGPSIAVEQLFGAVLAPVINLSVTLFNLRKFVLSEVMGSTQQLCRREIGGRVHVEGTVDEWPAVALSNAVLRGALDFVGLSFIQLPEES